MEEDLYGVLNLLVNLSLFCGLGLQLLLQVLEPFGRDREQKWLEFVDIQYLLLKEPFLCLSDKLEEKIDEEHPFLVDGSLRCDTPILKRSQVVPLTLLAIDPHDRYNKITQVQLSLHQLNIQHIAQSPDVNKESQHLQLCVEVDFDYEFIGNIEVHIQGLLDYDRCVCEGLGEDVVPDVAM